MHDVLTHSHTTYDTVIITPIFNFQFHIGLYFKMADTQSMIDWNTDRSMHFTYDIRYSLVKKKKNIGH